MLNLTIENVKTKETLELNRSNGYVLINVSGLQPVDADITTQKNIRVTGESITNLSCGSRVISLTLRLEGVEPYKARKALYQIATPMENVKLHIQADQGEFTAKGYIQSIQATQFSMTQDIQVDILCPSSYLEARTDSLAIGTNVENKFTFPFHTNADETFIMGEKKDVVKVVLDYDGDVATGGVFSVIAGADLMNPIISNLQTGEQMGITGTIEDGHTLRVSTKSGEKSIEIINNSDGSSENGLRYKNTVFDWLQLYRGENIYLLTADEGAEASTISIEYIEKFVGI